MPGGYPMSVEVRQANESVLILGFKFPKTDSVSMPQGLAGTAKKKWRSLQGRRRRLSHYQFHLPAPRSRCGVTTVEDDQFSTREGSSAVL
jgi:hypothetical protein